ncbi:MAG: PASTA domain-containing protein [Butyricicoccus sp.]
MPGLLGMTEDQARAALEAKGLKIGSVDSVDSSAEAGSVVAVAGCGAE